MLGPPVASGRIQSLVKKVTICVYLGFSMIAAVWGHVSDAQWLFYTFMFNKSKLRSFII